MYDFNIHLFIYFILGKITFRLSKFDDIKTWTQQKKDSRMFLLFHSIQSINTDHFSYWYFYAETYLTLDPID